MATPQITLRVPKEDKDRWHEAAASLDLSVSQVLRQLMNEWTEAVLEDEDSVV